MVDLIAFSLLLVMNFSSKFKKTSALSNISISNKVEIYNIREKT